MAVAQYSLWVDNGTFALNHVILSFKILSTVSKHNCLYTHEGCKV
eukprot:CAMPEP_0114239382 /NCGR_PEP_ID=MMETSP0058-20121206/8429_1 /TAXON_ID=36894 /ORGANISM="Pyramimonas parkeae, CCMP726" /LENGTH=44 /DNA_ID= /DNA_START= /DNA_END= /DNA_ORIENTATION=